jgi:hypothetical protein
MTGSPFHPAWLPAHGSENTLDSRHAFGPTAQADLPTPLLYDVRERALRQREMNFAAKRLADMAFVTGFDWVEALAWLRWRGVPPSGGIAGDAARVGALLRDLAPRLWPAGRCAVTNETDGPMGLRALNDVLANIIGKAWNQAQAKDRARGLPAPGCTWGLGARFRLFVRHRHISTDPHVNDAGNGVSTHRNIFVGGPDAHSRASPTVSATTAPRAPSGFGRPSVVSFAVWCSVSAFSSAPISTTTAESHIHVTKPIPVPSDP